MTEDLDVFLADMGVEVVWSAVTALGILDMPTIVQDSLVMSDEYVLTVKASEFAALPRGASLTVDGTAYTVRQAPMKIDDGKFLRVSLSKT